MPRLDLLRNGEIDLYRSSIKNAVETYPLQWKVIFEPLQNSIDAINDNGSVSEGLIHISMNLDRNEVAISDNGTGFAYDKNLFFMNGGTKGSRQDTKGKIGVGLKVTIFSTNRFHLTSVYRDGELNKSWAVEATDAFRYLDLDSLQMSVSNPSDTQLATGTSIVYSFPDDSVTRFIAIANDVMGEMSAVSPSNSVRFTKSLEYIFRTTGYAADVLRLLALPSTKRTLITMTVTYSSIPTTLPEPVREALSDLGGRIETTFENKFWDMEELIANQRGVNRPSVVSHKFYEPGVFGTLRPDTTIWVRKINSRQEMEELLSPRVRNSYGDLFPKINGIYLAMSVISNMRKFFFSTPPRFISINGTPSDHLLPNPVVNTLYANYVLCVIDVNSTLNYGKLQTTNRRLIHECGQLYLVIYRLAVI